MLALSPLQHCLVQPCAAPFVCSGQQRLQSYEPGQGQAVAQIHGCQLSRSLKSPTHSLLVQDELLPPIMMRQLHEAVTAQGAESCTWVEFEGAGHMDAYEVAQAVGSLSAVSHEGV